MTPTNTYPLGTLAALRNYQLREEVAKEAHDKAVRRAEEVEALYHELLYAVEKKHDGESRHATALRYIREREAPRGGPAQDA